MTNLVNLITLKQVGKKWSAKKEGPVSFLSDKNEFFSVQIGRPIDRSFDQKYMDAPENNMDKILSFAIGIFYIKMMVKSKAFDEES